MEQFVLGIFQEQLSKFIIGFRKEQVNANLLNGKGEIHNVELNCAFLNDHISKISPFVELESVHVSKLSFHVSSWTNLRKAPIIIDIGDVKVVVQEPLHYLDRTQRRNIQQITKSELLHLIRQGHKPTRGAYNLFDRILDNLTVEMRSIAISFQPWGKFKTRRPGPWTPPEIQMTMAGIRLASVNEYGQEAPPEEVWRHNHHRSTGCFLIYKKLEMEYQIVIRPYGSQETIPLISGHDNKMEIHLAMKRRIRDGEWLAVQVDTTIPKMEIDIPSHVVPLLAHTMAGVTYCMAKDRAFKDPLKAPSDADNTSDEDLHMSITLLETESANIDEEEGMDASAEIPVDIEDSSSSSSEDEAEIEMVDSTKADEESSQTAPKPQPAQQQPQETWSSKVKDRPVIMLPNGIVIHEKITLSLSVQQMTIRGTYAPSTNGYVQLVAKGCIAEAIWPKITQDKGGYAQASVSYVSIQEKHGQRVRTVLVGGAQYDNTGPVEEPRKPLFEVAKDETFPLYEDRSVRQDPLGLRHTFPAQAFGLKSSVDFAKKLEDDGKEEDIQVLHEVGIDHFDIVMDTSALCRALRFTLNEDGGGFDPRWHTGDWSKALTCDMLADPSAPLNLEECLQPTKQLFLDENEFISSDLFNVTARMTDVTIRAPAAIKEDVRSCDIVVRMNETMLVVSSALPRTFLSGKIGSAIHGEEAKQNALIDFPNDPSDVAYVLESSEDPSNRQRGVKTSRPISTFRLQLTLRGLSTRLVPVIPFCNAREPQQLLAPTELTMIICFEAEPPPSPESNLTKMVLFNSFEAHRFEINFDFDLIASAIITLSHHAEIVQETVSACAELLSSSHLAEESAMSLETSVEIAVEDGKIRKSMGGRRILVRRQIHQSRQTEGLSIAFCFQVTELRFRLWRQNVPYSTLVRSTRYNGDRADGHEKYLPLIRLMDFDVDGIELGLEGTFRRRHRRVVLKMCFSGMSLKACDFGSVLENQSIWETYGGPKRVEENGGEREPPSGVHRLIEIFGLGNDSFLEESPDISCETDDFAVAARFEEQKEHSRSWSAAIDIEKGGAVSCRVEEIESLALVVFEALLKPTWMKAENSTCANPAGKAIFPANTVGALILSLVPVVPSFGSIPSFEEEVKIALDSSARVPVKSVDTILRNVISKVVPSDVDLLLMRAHFSNMLVNVASKHSMDDSPKNVGFGLLLHSTDFWATYFASADALQMHSAILDVLARKGETWSLLADNRDEGLRHQLRSRQSLRYVLAEEGHIRTRDVLVRPFDFGYSYARSRASLSMPKGLDVENVESLDEFLACMHSFAFRCTETMSNMREVVSAIRGPNRQAGYDSECEKDVIRLKANPVGMACSRTAKSIRSVREIICRLNEKVKIHDLSLKNALLDKERQLKEIRILNFMREKERIAALALVASQATGWLRIGAAQRTGQRGLMTCMLWPHWAVLRKSILIAYAGPGRLKPIDIVSLQGASLRQLAGGPRKRDLKRAFALVERTGMVRLAVASSDSEYFMWVRELQRAIDISTPSSMIGSTKDAGAVAVSDQTFDGRLDDIGRDLDTSVHSSTDGLSQSSGHGRPLGRSLSKAVQAAKATKQAVVDRSIRRKDSREKGSRTEELGSRTPTRQTEAPAIISKEIPIPSTEELSTNSTTSNVEIQGDGSTPTKRLQLRNRFAGVSQATKSRFGSALHAAKQKGKEVADRRRQRVGQAGEELQVHSANHTQLETNQSGLSEPVLAKNDLGPASLSSTDPESSWSCSACTFINPAAASTCQICDSPKAQGSGASPCELEGHDERVARETPGLLDSSKVCADEAALGEHKSEASLTEEQADDDGGDSYLSDVGDDFELDDRGHRRRMRERLGAAVRSVRRGGEAPGDSRRTSGRFSLRRRNASIREEFGDDSIRSAPSSVKLRNVRTAGPLVPPVHPFGESYPQDLDVPLKRLEGSWYVRVHVETYPEAPQEDTATSDIPKNSPEPGLLEQNENFNESRPEEATSSLTVAGPFSTLQTHDEEEQTTTEEVRSPGVMDSLAQPSRGPSKEVDASSSAQDETMEGAAESVEEVHSTAPDSAVLSQSEASFCVQIFRQLGEEVGRKPVAEILRKLDDILALHTCLSESVSRVLCAASIPENAPERSSTGSMTESLARVLGLTAVDTVRITGNLLGGLLASGTSHSVFSSLEHHAGVISEFLNSVLDCPLPIDGLVSLTDFLEIIDASTENVPSAQEAGLHQEHVQLDSIDLPTQNVELDIASDIFALSAICETQLLTAEQHGLQAEKLANSGSKRSSGIFTSPFREPDVHPGVANQFQEAMYSTVMKVMEERDEAHARLVAASVLHVHEIEQQRKKADHLATQLESAKRATGSGPRSADIEMLRQRELQMQQSTDEELVSLCQQLAGEISARTSADLEVIRLKESRTIERDNEEAEKRALQEELARVKKQLAEERAKIREVQQESLTWRTSYERIMLGTESQAQQMSENE